MFKTYDNDLNNKLSSSDIIY